VIERLAMLECALTDEARADRARRWRAVQARSSERTETELIFATDARLAAELAELAALETVCCRAGFRLEIAPSGIRLELRR
jgi:hypothetical protein